jgi:hypothetical protein
MAEEVSSALEQVKAWSAPALLAVVSTMALFIWNVQQGRLETLENEVSSYRATLATISESQRNAAENRVEFQTATTSRLDRMEDVLIELSSNISALTAVQAERKAPAR